MSIKESSTFNFLLRLNFHFFTLIFEIFACNCISGPKIIAFLRTKFIYLLWNQFPKTFIIQLMIVWLFQIKFFSWKWRWNHAFVFSMFKIYDIVRFYFAFLLKVFISVVEYKLPITFTFVFIDNRNSFVNRFFDWRSFLDVTFLNATFFRLNNFVRLI